MTMTSSFSPSTGRDDISKVRVAADVFWAELNRQNKMSGKYQAILGNLSERACDELSSLGVTIHSNTEKSELGNYITVKSNNPMRAWDENTGEELVDVLIGNGSKAIATITAYQWNYQGKKGVSPSLQRLGIKQLVEFKSNAVDDDDSELEIF